MDAPDLGDPTAEAEQLKISKKTGGNGGQQNALDGFANQSRAKKSGSVSPKRELSSAPSASLRTDLLSEIEGLGSADDAALWVQRRLAAKNQLSVADAQQVEKAFAAKLRLVQHKVQKLVISRLRLGARAWPRRPKRQHRSTSSCSLNRGGFVTVTISDT